MSFLIKGLVMGDDIEEMKEASVRILNAKIECGIQKLYMVRRFQS
jgi:hypothetical protein